MTPMTKGKTITVKTLYKPNGEVWRWVEGEAPRRIDTPRRFPLPTCRNPAAQPVATGRKRLTAKRTALQ